MQGLVNLATEVADGIAVLLPAACYLMACGCFCFFAWTLWTWSEPHSRIGHVRHPRPWVPFVSLLLSGVFATFPVLLTKANISFGSDVTVALTQYSATSPGSAGNILGATPYATVTNVVALFQYFFQAFGAACVFWAIVRWRGIVNQKLQGSPLACGIQFVFGVCCINILRIATGLQQLFQIGG